MKIGAKVHFFNYEMRKRRAELGWSQRRLAEESGLNINIVSTIELLYLPHGDIRLINDKLAKLARTLGVDFHLLFPDEYLDMIIARRLPRRDHGRSYLWIYDISLDQLPDNAPELFLPGADEEVFASQKSDVIKEAIAGLPEHERISLIHRFGLNGNRIVAIQETARFLGVSEDRVRHLQSHALQRLRRKAQDLYIYVQ